MDILERIKKREIGISVQSVDDKNNLKFLPDVRAEVLRLAELGQRMQWVSIKERLPLPDKMVLCCSKDGVIRTGYYYDCWHTGRFPMCVTHWMPLPPNPGGRQNGE